MHPAVIDDRPSQRAEVPDLEHGHNRAGPDQHAGKDLHDRQVAPLLSTRTGLRAIGFRIRPPETAQSPADSNLGHESGPENCDEYQHALYQQPSPIDQTDEPGHSQPYGVEHQEHVPEFLLPEG